MTAIPTCPSCGADLVAAAGGRTQDAPDQTASERDQTASDQDQTWADHDQGASDSDQRSADDDQKAADDDYAAGGEARAHSRSTEARERSTQDREDVSALRDESGTRRARTAEERDRAAERRDREAESSAELARRLGEQGSSEPTVDPLLRAQEDRARAAADRVRAADDRARAAADREQAAHERAEAVRSRTESADLLRRATTDELTGAWTRKFGLEQVAREVERAHRTGVALVLAFIDVVGLKQVNDDRGHLAGDALLHRTGEALRANLRRYDVIVRYGGDEFVCAMPNLTFPEAKTRFESIAAELTAADAEHSISFGLALAAPTDGLEELIARADADLLGSRRSVPPGD
ncbi:MAG: diguanylate cyclase domain-containing protein [Gaiellaceae bacterium]